MKKAFKVIWEVEVNADTPQLAAAHALNIQSIEQNPAIFTVTEIKTNYRYTVDGRKREIMKGHKTNGTGNTDRS